MPSSFDNMIYACIFMFTAGVSGRITDPPLNAVADVGGQAILNCTSDLTVQNWVFSKTREEVDGNMPTVQTIVAGCVVQPGFTTNYEVDRPGGSNNKCNLIVKATTMQQAGVYTCTDTIAGPSSILTVIDGDASITVDKQQETVEGDEVTLSYTVRYSTSTASPNTPTIQPVLSWKDPDGNSITSSNSNTSATVISSISIKAERQDIRPYTCSISHEIKWPSPPTGLPFVNNTPSSLSNPPPTSTINVLYNASTPIITRDLDSKCGTFTLTCNSSGNPPPKYKWFNLTNDFISEKQNITSKELGQNQSHVTCEAYSTIRYVTNSTFTNFTVSEKDYSSNCDINEFPGTIDRTTTIILAAVLGGFGLLNIIATIFFIVYYNRESNKAKLNARFTWLQRMLPCMNESRDNCGCAFVWVILFFVMSILAGIIVFPILVAMVNCSKRRHASKDISDISMSNRQEHSDNRKPGGSPSTAAHGDVEDPYDVVGTTRNDRLYTLDEPTSEKDAKKVFYTRVNPNCNTDDDDVQRYSVSLPRQNPKL